MGFLPDHSEANLLNGSRHGGNILIIEAYMSSPGGSSTAESSWTVGFILLLFGSTSSSCKGFLLIARIHHTKSTKIITKTRKEINQLGWTRIVPSPVPHAKLTNSQTFGLLG